jgi:hypothetical protein
MQKKALFKSNKTQAQVRCVAIGVNIIERAFHNNFSPFENSWTELRKKQGQKLLLLTKLTANNSILPMPHVPNTSKHIYQVL